MRRPSTTPLRAAFIVATLAACPLHARTLSVAVEHIHRAGLQVDGLRVDLVEHEDRSSLHLVAAHLAAEQLGLAGHVEWRCDLSPNGALRSCSGPVQLESVGSNTLVAELSATLSEDEIRFALVHSDGTIALAMPLHGAPLRLSLQHVPARWLKTPLATFWRGGELRAGRFDVEASVGNAGQTDATASIDAVEFNTFDGSVSAEGLAASLELHATFPTDETRLRLDASLRTGTLHAGAAEIVLPGTDVQAHLDARVSDSGDWTIDQLVWSDPGVLSMESSGEFNPAALAPLSKLHMRIDSMQFPEASARYLKPLLADTGLGSLSLQGTLAGELDADRLGLQRFSFQTRKLDIRDEASSVALKGIHGGLDWARRGKRPATVLAWREGDVKGLRIPSTSARWQSQDGSLHLLGILRSRFGNGTLALSHTVVDPLAVDSERLSTAFTLDQVGYDSADGSIAVAAVNARGELGLSGNVDAPHIRIQAQLNGGEVLDGPIYVKLPATPVQTRLDAQLAEGTWRIDKFDWNDAGALVFTARGELTATAPYALNELRVDLLQAKLDTAVDRYARSWLASKGYAQMEATGSLRGEIAIDASGLQSFSFASAGVNIDDGADRFSVRDLSGSLDWSVQGDRPHTTLDWQAAHLFDVPLGAAHMAFDSVDGALNLAQPVAIDILGGRLQLEKLRLQPGSLRGERYAGSFAIVGIEMAQLSKVFGWPQFPGNLSGGIPEIEFAGDTIQLNGGLDLYVFDGHLGVSGLTLEHPFGNSPSLGANIHFENFDLEQVTSAFSFGSMSGRLNGAASQLRLIDWSPVAMNARLETSGGGRMSYNAVNDLATIGGGAGLSGSLQTLALQLFDTFGYSKLGLRCQLRKQVCAMGGVEPIADPGARDPASSGYTIVQGSGLPRITIIGHHRRVDWPTLLRRLRESTEGNGPIVE